MWFPSSYIPFGFEKEKGVLTKETNFDLTDKYKVTLFSFLTQPDNSISFFLKVKKELGYRQIRMMLWLSGKIFLSNNSILFFLLRKDTCILSYFSRVQLFVTVCNSNLLSSSVCRFLLQEYWNGLLCPLHAIFPTQGSNLCSLCLLHWQAFFFFFSTLAA